MKFILKRILKIIFIQIYFIKYSVLRTQLPTIAFKASTQKQRSNFGRSSNVKSSSAYGADELTKLLSAFAKRKGIKTGITCAVVGFPNVGKSSVINSLTRERSCQVSATAGSTKTTQEVAIDKAVRLLGFFSEFVIFKQFWINFSHQLI